MLSMIFPSIPQIMVLEKWVEDFCSPDADSRL